MTGGPSLGWSGNVSAIDFLIRRLGQKDAERKRFLREKNEKLQERITMYESYRKRYLKKVPLPVTFVHINSLLEPFVLLTQDALSLRILAA